MSKLDWQVLAKIEKAVNKIQNRTNRSRPPPKPELLPWAKFIKSNE